MCVFNIYFKSCMFKGSPWSVSLRALSVPPALHWFAKKVKLRFLCIIWLTITQFDALQITPSAAREIPPHTTPAKTPACQMIHCERALILLRQPSAHSTGFTFQGIAQKKESAWKIARRMPTHKTESGF